MVIEGLYVGNNASIENVERLKMLVSIKPIYPNLLVIEHISRAGPGLPSTN